MFDRYYYERAVGEHRHYVLHPDAEGVVVGNKLVKHQGVELVCSVVLVANRTS